MATALRVWMNGEAVGLWTEGRGGAVFRYDEAWWRSPNVRALSLSLPLTPGSAEIRGPVVTHYFDNLLPDSDTIRARLRARFGVTSRTSMDLLRAIGRDCVGAIQLLPPDDAPTGWDRIDGDPLDEAQVARLLAAVTTPGSPGDADDDFRFSIAGAQEKTALLWHDGRWHRPRGATPTSHILKLPLGLVGNVRADMRDSVDNEWLCAQLLQALGLSVAPTSIGRFEAQRVLVVERFDRRVAGQAARPWIARLPQEDFCQATGTPPDRKYETDGGPTMVRCLDLLSGSTRAPADRSHFLRTQLAFWLLAATDGHAKNFSLFHQRGGGFRLTPLYDVLSAWPIIGEGADRISPHRARLAMAVRTRSAHHRLREIQTRHWQALALSVGGEALWTEMVSMVERTDQAVAAVEQGVPADLSAAVWAAITRGLREQAARFRRGLTPG
ncbi:type II toxin-antitoxin system HipA family toxin [Sphaerotilus sp.]|uniref:type II toxin-antitoxin system HipA family toxin n=1 Tax=Sphaerotilus sp. TaxID=2093942 RepID=UPI002ACEB40B|nr:type II toxin-antitoxin system HipA family toxin [Sphaerotilus sp.]MDZ7857277.1 type II toxin-antitoxin system HipA family toxin [Sphaerotilus sp.]